MRRAVAVAGPGAWPPQDALGTVTLAWADRHRRRIVLADDAGEPFLLDLERAALLAEGDGLVLDGGGVIVVRAAEEDVLEARAGTAAQAARLAWHLGNRHTPVQVLADGGLRLLDDPVLAEMLRGLGAEVTLARAPFAPEAGAYARPAEQQGHAHQHHHARP